MVGGCKADHAVLGQHIRRFLLVGSGGFILDLAVLGVLIYQFGVDRLTARFVAFAFAASFTYYFNAKYTYEDLPRGKDFSKYVIIQTMGAVINLGTYTLLVLRTPLAEQPLVALACGAMIATTANFVLTRKYVFKNW